MRRFALPSIIALVLGISVMAGQFVFAQTKTGKAAYGRSHKPHMVYSGKGLNLTAEQQAQARVIFKDAHQKVMAVLTPEQQQAAKEKIRQGARTMNLTADQKGKVEAIRKDAKAQAEAIKADTRLTEEQKNTQLRDLHSATRKSIGQVLGIDKQAKPRVGTKQAYKTKGDTLNLTTEQIAEIRSIRKDAAASFRSILNAEQQAQLDKRSAKRTITPKR